MESFLNDAERKIRKFWLIQFLFFSGLVVGFLVNSIYNDAASGRYFLAYIIGECISVIFSLILIYWVYYCAYRKFGRVWLLILLILMPIGFLLFCFQTIKGYIPFYSVALTVFRDVISYIFNFKLYQINKKIYLRFLNASPEYNRLILEIKTACSLNDLFKIYTNEIKNNPFFEKSLRKEFKKRRKVLRKEKKFQLDS